jgi:hypothetical protein
LTFASRREAAEFHVLKTLLVKSSKSHRAEIRDVSLLESCTAVKTVRDSLIFTGRGVV